VRLLRNTVTNVLLAVGALAVAPTYLTVLLAMASIFVIHAVTDMRWRRALMERVD